MGKNKRSNVATSKKNPQSISTKKAIGIKRRQHSQITKAKQDTNSGRTSKQSKGRLRQPTKLKIPFTRWDRVLLVGEGDFSFASSLAKHCDVASIVATSYDDLATLRQKYTNIDTILASVQNSAAQRIVGLGTDIDDTNEESEWKGFPASEDAVEEPTAQAEADSRSRKSIVLLHGIDATALSKARRKILAKHAPFTKIVFNFPHTGGLSTDVNRQVRVNQELLVGFFNSAKPLLATENRPARSSSIPADTSNIEYDSEDEQIVHQERRATLSSAQILVTLFEGEPYTLWNVRDLARHCGLQVVESFKFPWAAFPGYKHARTAGDITTGRDRSDENKRKGAWRGEEREARTYVFGLKEEVEANVNSRKKRKRGSDSDDDG